MDFKKIKKVVCGKCHKRAIPGQPLERCRECKLKFCPDHFWRGQYNKERVGENEELGVICDECKKKFGYIDLDEYFRLKNSS